MSGSSAWPGILTAPLLIVGCSVDTSGPTNPASSLAPSFYVEGSSTTCGGTGTNNSYLDGVDRECLTHGTIYFTLSGLSDNDVSGPFEEWNRYLREAPELPLLATQLGSGGIPLIRHANSTSYCGGTIEGSNGRVSSVNIWPSTHASCQGKQSGSLAAVLTHELSHALGWNSGHGSDSAATTTTAGCTSFLA